MLNSSIALAGLLEAPEIHSLIPRTWMRSRIKSSYAWRPLLDHGAVLAFRSDAPDKPSLVQ